VAPAGDTQRGSGDRPALSRLIPHPFAQFAGQYWGQRPLVTAGSELGEDFCDLFSLEAVDELVADRNIRTPFVRMAHDGNVLSPSRYTSGGGYGAEIADQLDSAKVLTEFANGSTLVLQGLHRTWPAIATFIRQLDADLGYPCQVNAYVTPASSRGFDPHYDVHDVFVIQIHGQKRWTIHEPVHRDPLPSQPWSDHRDAVAAQASGPAAIEHTFSPGDVLYLPRGWIHSATALGGTSIHLTIGIGARTRYDIVQQVLARLADDENLRRSLPLGLANARRVADGQGADGQGADGRDADGQDAVRASVRQTLAELATALARDDVVETAAAELAGTLGAQSRPVPVRPLATIESAARLGANTLVAWRLGLRARLNTDDRGVHIVLREKTISLPSEASAAVRALVAGAPTPAGQLPGLDASSSLVVARRLIREAVLVLP
jgi:hypothetical protein